MLVGIGRSLRRSFEVDEDEMLAVLGRDVGDAMLKRAVVR
jgi:hypothetical protein